MHRLCGVFLTAIGTDGIQIEASFCEASKLAKEQKSRFRSGNAQKPGEENVQTYLPSHGRVQRAMDSKRKQEKLGIYALVVVGPIIGTMELVHAFGSGGKLLRSRVPLEIRVPSAAKHDETRGRRGTQHSRVKKFLNWCIETRYLLLLGLVLRLTRGFQG